MKAACDAVACLLVGALVGILIIGCGTLRLEADTGDLLKLKFKCSAPSYVEVHLNDDMVFELQYAGALPANVRCEPPLLKVSP